MSLDLGVGANGMSCFPRVSGDEPRDGYQVEHAG